MNNIIKSLIGWDFVFNGWVSITDFRNNLTNYIDLALAGKNVTVRDEKKGVDILYRCLHKPLWHIALNAGTDPGWVVKKVEAAKEADYGFNALTMEFGSLHEAGIVDPVKVTRLALQNAVSIGSMVLTTEALITDLPEKTPQGGGMPQMPPGGGEY